MRILITNDDGAGAAQLVPLIRWCGKLGDVTAVVPKVEQSGKSHSIEIHKPFEAKQVELTPDVTVWAVDSTPADCVRFACSGLGLTFDLVISGVNRGLNLGHDIMYSGTFAAACEAVNNGMKAIALSTAIQAYEHSTEHLDSIFSFLEENRLLEQHDLYNINIPDRPKGIRITRMGGPYFLEKGIVGTVGGHGGNGYVTLPIGNRIQGQILPNSLDGLSHGHIHIIVQFSEGFQEVRAALLRILLSHNELTCTGLSPSMDELSRSFQFIVT